MPIGCLVGSFMAFISSPIAFIQGTREEASIIRLLGLHCLNNFTTCIFTHCSKCNATNIRQYPSLLSFFSCPVAGDGS